MSSQYPLDEIKNAGEGHQAQKPDVYHPEPGNSLPFGAAGTSGAILGGGRGKMSDGKDHAAEDHQNESRSHGNR